MRTISLTVAASAFGLLGGPWTGGAVAATAPVVLLDGGNPGCEQVLDDADPIAINNPTGGTVSGPGGQMIEYSMNAERTLLESWAVVAGGPVTVVIVRNSGGQGGPKVFEYLYNPPGILEDAEFIAPGGDLISKITFCYGVEGNGLGAEPAPQVSIEDLPCPDPTFEQSVCQDDSAGNDVVAFFFDTTATGETDEHGHLATLPVGVCSCDGIVNEEEEGNNNLTECSLDINDDDYCFKEEDFTFSNIQAFRGIDAFCTTNDELGSTICSTFCVRGFPGGTSFSCGN